MTNTDAPKPVKRTEAQQEQFEQAIKDKVDDLLQATRACFEIVGRPRYFQPDLLRIAYDVLHLDPALVEGGWETTLGFRWSRHLRPTWSLHTEMEVRFDVPYRSPTHVPLRSEFAERVRVELSWPSGGGSPSKAVAQASQHLELAQQATRVEIVYQRAVLPPEDRYGRMAEDDPARVVEAALERLCYLRERAWDKIRSETKEQAAYGESE